VLDQLAFNLQIRIKLQYSGCLGVHLQPFLSTDTCKNYDQIRLNNVTDANKIAIFLTEILPNVQVHWPK
ncbi:Hypothetical predicted protein, partial [Olea europaea subsp. europaea]